MADYSWFVALVDLLAVYRLVRLIVKDSLLNGPRFWMLQRWPSELTQYPDSIVVERQTVKGVTTGKLSTGVEVYLAEDEVWEAARTHKWAELLECSWCASAYVAAGVVALRYWWDWWHYPALVLAFSALVGLMFTHWDNT